MAEYIRIKKDRSDFGYWVSEQCGFIDEYDERQRIYYVVIWDLSTSRDRCLSFYREDFDFITKEEYETETLLRA